MQSIYKQSRSDSDWLQSTSDSVKVKGLHSSMFSFINTDRLPACWLQHAGNMNTSSLCIKEVNSAGWQVVVSCLYTYRNSVSWAPRTFNSYIYLTDWNKSLEAWRCHFFMIYFACNVDKSSAGWKRSYSKGQYHPQNWLSCFQIWENSQPRT